MTRPIISPVRPLLRPPKGFIFVEPATPRLIDFFHDEMFLRPATPRVVNFTEAKDVYHERDENGVMGEFIIDDRPASQADFSGRGNPNLLMTHAQVNRRANRRAAKGKRITKEAWNATMKPIEEWDEEELARGRPRNAGGTFTGPKPKFLPREVHERAVERFKGIVRSEMNYQTLSALKTVETVLKSEEVDHRGKPIVSAGVKIQAATFLIEHVIGKPTQPINTDVSVKLQGILGTVMVNPVEMQGNDQYTAAHMGARAIAGAPQVDSGIIEAEVIDDEDNDDD